MEKRNFLKRTLAVLLALVAVLSCFSAAFAAANIYPIIYIWGRTWLYNDVSTDSPKLLRYSTSEALEEVITAAAPSAATAILTNNYDSYNEKTYDLLMDVFDGFALDQDGNVANDTGVLYSWSEDTIPKTVASTNLATYHYEYDARLSPLEIADDLNNYIETVKRVCGRSRVSLVGRCLGANIMFAYLQKYQEPVNYRGVSSVVLYNSSLYGVDMLDAALGGTIKVDTKALGNFLEKYKPSVSDESLSTAIVLGLQMLQSSTGKRLSASVAQNFYDNIRDTLVLRFLKNTYATAPGFWSMVYRYYDEAKEYIFGTPEDRETYAKLIEKIDDYRYNVQLRAGTMIKDMQNAGVHVASICKYGMQGYPLYEDCFKQSDNTVLLWRQSMGATCSDIDCTLGRTYINNRTSSGLGGYIAPDGQVDAFTSVLPDTTWYIKFYEHNAFVSCVEPLIVAICREHIDVKTRSEWPQFMIMSGTGKNQKIFPMTADNCDPNGDIKYDGDSVALQDSFFGRLVNMFNRIINFFRNLIGMFVIQG